MGNHNKSRIAVPGKVETGAVAPHLFSNDIRDRIAEELKADILPFWIQNTLDHEHGGFIPRLTNDLKPNWHGPKGLILNARILWTFSAVHRFEASTVSREMACKAYDYLARYFEDRDFGGVYWFLNPQGQVIDDSKKIYGQAFYIYALAEFHRAFGGKPALQTAINLFGLIEKHAHDAQFNGYVEACNRNWSEAADLRLSAKDQNEKKSMNNHLHVLEAYTNLHRVWQSPVLRDRLVELIELFEQKITDPASFHFHHFFDEQWTVKSRSYTYGHDIEGSWLLSEAAEVLGDPAIISRVSELSVKIARAVLDEGLDRDGGLCYEGRAGKVVNANREFWPQAEAVVGFLNAYRISRDLAFYDAAVRAWNYIEAHLVDRTHGEWFWRVDRQGNPDQSEFKVSEWKCPYHNGRACLEAIRRLDEIHDKNI
jgi:mannobiose 2-epimerase